jgi:proline iminopeptidase
VSAAYPKIEPYDQGMLDVGDGNLVYWETSGNPNGKPALVLHGGPGGGSRPGRRRYFDPALYKIVQFDQRGCGQSTPSVADPAVSLAANTTGHLLADIELLRGHLGVKRWLVFGGSWGTTLGLAYAERHPDQVSELVLAAVVGTAIRREVEWITRDVARHFPAEWPRFRDGVPAADRDGSLVQAYARLLNSPDEAVRVQAARDWCAWEDTHVSLFPANRHDSRYDDPDFRMVFARLVTHYWSNDCFLEEDELLRDIGRLAGIPGVMVHGRLDISGPIDIPWQLAQAWPDSELVIIDDAAHGGSATMTETIVAATDRFALLL